MSEEIKQGDCAVCTGTNIVLENKCRNCGAVNGKAEGVFAFTPFTDIEAPVVEAVPAPAPEVVEVPTEPVSIPEETPKVDGSSEVATPSPDGSLAEEPVK